jgi:hypothetical protein
VPAALGGAPVSMERRGERGPELVSVVTPVAPPASLSQELAELGLGAGLRGRATVHQGVRSAQCRARAAPERDRNERAPVALTANAAPRPGDLPACR